MEELGEERKFSRSTILVVILVIAISVTPRIHVGTLQYDRRVDLRYEDFAIALVLYLWLLAAFMGKRIYLRSPISKPLLFYVMVSIISTVVGVYAGWVEGTRAFFYALKELEYFILFLVILNSLFLERDLMVTAWAIILLSMANNVYSFFQIATGNFKGLYGVALIGEDSPFGIGGYLSMCFLLSISLISSGFLRAIKSNFLKGMVLVNTFACMFSLIYTGSRAFIYGTTAAFLAFLLVRRERRVLVFLLFIIVVVSVFYYNSTVSPELPDQRPILERILSLGKARESYLDRLERAYRPVVAMLSRNPITGFGKSILGYKGMPTEAHNSVLRVLLEVGILGLAAFIWLIAEIIRMSARILRRDASPIINAVSMTCLLSTVSIIVASLVQDAFTPVKVNEMYWIIVGMAAVAGRLLERTEDAHLALA